MKALERSRILNLASERPSYIKERTHLLCGGQHKSLETPDLQLGAERGHIQKALFSAFCLVFKFYQLTHSGDTVFCLLSCPQVFPA